MKRFGSHKNQHNGSGSDEVGQPGWQIIYTGFILILLCFFIMLSSFATMEESKVARFVRSFVSAISVTDGGLSFDAGKEVVAPSGEIVDIRSQLAEIFREVEIFTEETGRQENVELAMTAQGLVIRLSEKALFSVGSAEIGPSARPLLDQIGGHIAEVDLPVRIEGHTDDLPIHTERYPSNWELSTARAVNVLRYLLQRFDIPAERLAAAGYGEYRPRAPNETPKLRQKNRRVEIILLNTAQNGETP